MYLIKRNPIIGLSFNKALPHYFCMFDKRTGQALWTTTKTSAICYHGKEQAKLEMCKVEDTIKNLWNNCDFVCSVVEVDHELNEVDPTITAYDRAMRGI